MRVLYLGLDPKNICCVHYPVIRTEKIVGAELREAQALWPQFTHVIFTSQSAVGYWEGDLRGKRLIAIGEATGEAIRKRGGAVVVARDATQEGVIDLLKSLDLRGAFLFMPRSKKARPNLAEFLKSYRSFVLDLYDTVFQKLEPVPKLEEFSEIVFTSPSTVEGFSRIYEKIPPKIKLTAIGPITQERLDLKIAELERCDLQRLAGPN